MKMQEMLRLALVDLLDGCKGPHEIQEQTGLPAERCSQIYDLYLLAALDALPVMPDDEQPKLPRT